MDKKLLIVESPAKVKSVGKILGADFVVMSSVGHIRDLPEHSLGVDIENRFEPTYEISDGKKKVVDGLKKAAKECSALYLAPDPDREGEAIAWHLRELLASSIKGRPVFRVSYNEITPAAVRAAMAAAGEIHQARVDAQQARRILDRIVGYMVSPLLWRRIQRGLSAGRVQSVALRLVCERERLILAFMPQPYWVFGANVEKAGDPFTIKLAKINGEKPAVADQPAADAILAELEGRALRVADIKTRTVTRRPLPPFITSTLQQAASSFLGLSPSRTMRIAQDLYEGVEMDGSATGLITYMRTDSVSVSRDAQEAVRAYILSEHGADFVPEKPNFFASSAHAQQAHEAIRPTDPARTPSSLRGVLDAASLKLYDLIWRRFVASQMSSARILQKTVEIASCPPPAQNQNYLFTASSSDIEFPGFLKVMALDIKKSPKPKDKDKDKDAGDAGDDDADAETDQVDHIPALAAGDEVLLREWLCERKETKPPARYSEASLVKALEANGVGRPSTYASIIETIVTRKYASREKRVLAPTTLGFKVNDLLVDKLNTLFDVGFTAAMEAELDQVEDGAVEWRAMMGKFYGQFKGWLDNAKEPPAETAQVRGILGLLATVTEWAEPVKVGNRVFGDEKFTVSVRNQFEEGKRPVTEKQLARLVLIGARYVAQIPNFADALQTLNITPPSPAESAEPDPNVKLRFDAIQGIEFPGDQPRFLTSLQQQFERGRNLSENQLRALDRILSSNAANIPGYEQLAQTVNLVAAPAAAISETEITPLLDALGHVTQWREPVKRGRRTFDDKEFCDSLAKQFATRRSLSERQVAALKKVVSKYAAQIPGYADLAQKLNLPARKETKENKSSSNDANEHELKKQ